MRGERCARCRRGEKLRGLGVIGVAVMIDKDEDGSDEEEGDGEDGVSRIKASASE
jgi:hypothetical protein